MYLELKVLSLSCTIRGKKFILPTTRRAWISRFSRQAWGRGRGSEGGCGARCGRSVVGTAEVQEGEAGEWGRGNRQRGKGQRGMDRGEWVEGNGKKGIGQRGMEHRGMMEQVWHWGDGGGVVGA